LQDSVRGVGKYLISSLTNTEGSQSNLVSAYNSNGISLGNDNSVNQASNTFVAWCWKANGTNTYANAAGTNGASIASTYSANQAAGFSIVTWSGTSANGTIGHGLGAVPKLILVKSRNAVHNWQVYHGSLPSTALLLLNSTAAQASNPTSWNSTAPTSSVFSVGTDNSTSGETYVAYAFSEVPGFSKFGSYAGNGNADGPFIYTGFKPRWVMIKNTTAASVGSWQIRDTSRDAANSAGSLLWADRTNMESADPSYNVDILSNGFKIRGTASDDNANSNTYIYAAFADQPMGGSNASPATAR
jgi:hypothetical protein